MVMWLYLIILHLHIQNSCCQFSPQVCIKAALLSCRLGVKVLSKQAYGGSARSVVLICSNENRLVLLVCLWWCTRADLTAALKSAEHPGHCRAAWSAVSPSPPSPEPPGLHRLLLSGTVCGHFLRSPWSCALCVLLRGAVHARVVMPY